MLRDVYLGHEGYRSREDWRIDENKKTSDKNIVSGRYTLQKPSQNVTKLQNKKSNTSKKLPQNDYNRQTLFCEFCHFL